MGGVVITLSFLARFSPVGFVGAAESKALARESRHRTITNVGEKGGSAVAAAVANALRRLADAR